MYLIIALFCDLCQSNNAIKRKIVLLDGRFYAILWRIKYGRE
jgi:hypothetical protein